MIPRCATRANCVINTAIKIIWRFNDEQNLLCCVIAKKTSNCQTIARVRNPIYNEEIDFLKEEFGLSMIINPELTAAGEIAKIFQFPSAIRVDTFARGHVELLHC